jgi:hypothetical protein
MGQRQYSERLRAPVWLLAVALGFCATLGLAVLPALGPLPAIGAFAVAAGATVWWFAASAALVEVHDGTLRAGRARIPVTLLGEAVPLDARRAGLLRGADIDPAAYHLIRGWVATAVLVDVTDPNDRTPYWYVATRHPEKLAAAIDQARAAAQRRR